MQLARLALHSRAEVYWELKERHDIVLNAEVAEVIPLHYIVSPLHRILLGGARTMRACVGRPICRLLVGPLVSDPLPLGPRKSVWAHGPEGNSALRPGRSSTMGVVIVSETKGGSDAGLVVFLADPTGRG